MTSHSGTRRRIAVQNSQLRESEVNVLVMDSKPAEAGQSVELADFRAAKDSRPVPARLVSFSRQFFRETVPAWLTVGVMLALIFGGCCSNVCASAAPNPPTWQDANCLQVYALEAIVK